MYIKVLIGEYARGECGESGYHPSSEILVNPDCPIRIIYDYFRMIFEVEDCLEVDLCDESGNLIFMYEREPWMNGLNFLTPKSVYLAILFEKNEDNRTTNPMLYLPEAPKKTSNQMNEMMAKIKKQLNPAIYSKPSRMGKTRSGTSYAK